jgi:hypothetical protein
MTAAPMESVPFSDLLRKPTETTERLTRTRAIKLRRRDDDDLVLMSAERAATEAEVMEIMARILSELAREHPDFIHEVLPTALPWIRHLPADGVEVMAKEFVETAEAATSLGNLASVRQLLIEWQHTAEVYADPELLRILTEPSDGDFGPVPRP